MNTDTTERGFDSFAKHLALTVLFFTATPVVIVSSVISLVSLSKTPPTEHKSVTQTSVQGYSTGPNIKLLAPQVDTSILTSVNIASGDARSELLRQYLKRYHSPLEPYADFIVKTSDKYLLDYRLLVAISQQESNLCKASPDGSNNCWGWGIHSKGSLGFESFENAIETVARGIREEYVNKGYQTVEDIMAKYTPASSGSWAYGVSYFMDEIEN